MEWHLHYAKLGIDYSLCNDNHGKKIRAGNLELQLKKYSTAKITQQLRIY